MATVRRPEPPASLEDEYRKLVTVHGRISNRPITAQIGWSVRTAQPPESQSPTQAGASAAARWLTDQHRPTADRHTRSAFFRDRRKEYLNGTFPFTYWLPLAPNRDVVQYGEPNFFDDPPHGIPPEYQDPLHQPSVQRYGPWSLEYPYNTAGTPAQPIPGWHGQIENTFFHDKWFAQRVQRYVLPEPLTKASARPIAATVMMTITAQATTRGNRAWFSPIVHARFPASPGITAEQKKLHVYYPRDERYRFAIPDDQPGGWIHTIQEQRIINVRSHERWSASTTATTCELIIATPPALGRYHARNDEVHVTHQEEVHVFIGRSNDG